MATILIILAILPALYGLMITGDFFQYLYKPTRRQIYFVLTNRQYFVGASVVLWAGGLIWHFLYFPSSTGFLIIGTTLGVMFFIFGFLMPGYILFRGLNRPDWISAADVNNCLGLLPGEFVIGLEIEGDSRAYPIESMLRPHRVDEVVGGEAVIMTYCMLSNSAMAFKAEFSDHKIRFITPLQWENNMMLYDESADYLIQQITGRIVGGPEDGQALETYPTYIMPWAAWRHLHPNTKVLYHPARRLFDKFFRTVLRTQIHELNQGREAPIIPTITEFDSRLPNKTKVLGVSVQETSKAYPLSFLKQQLVINDTLKGEPLLVAYDPKQEVGAIFYRRHQGQTLTFLFEFSADGNFIMIDEQTQSTWNMCGLAIAGIYEGAQLTPYTHLNQVFWYSWFNFYPNTEVAS